MEKLKAKFTDDLPEIDLPKKSKERETGEVVAKEIRDGREYLTVRFESGDVSGFKDELFKIERK